LKEEGFNNKRFVFVQSDAINYLSSIESGRFDVILCFGFFYHTTDQIKLLNEVTRLRPAHFILDTHLATYYHATSSWYKKLFFRYISRRLPALIFRTESHQSESNTIDPTNIVSAPSEAFLDFYFRKNDYLFKRLPWDKQAINDWTGMDDYKNGDSASYLLNFHQAKS